MAVKINCEASKEPGINHRASFLFSWIRLHLSVLQALAQGVREMQRCLYQLCLILFMYQNEYCDAGQCLHGIWPSAAQRRWQVNAAAEAWTTGEEENLPRAPICGSVSNPLLVERAALRPLLISEAHRGWQTANSGLRQENFPQYGVGLHEALCPAVLQEGDANPYGECHFSGFLGHCSIG